MSTSNTAAWVEAIGSILVVIVAVFHDFIYRWWTRPILDVSIKSSPPNCHMVRWGRSMQVGSETHIHTVPVYYMRMCVENKGKRQADNVQVRVMRIEKRQLDGTYVPYDEFPPMNLAWALNREAFLPTIHPQTSESCDLAHIFRPEDRNQPFEQRTWEGVDPNKTVLSIDTVSKSYTLFHLLPAGTYRMHITASSNESKPVRRVIEVTLRGEWYDSERQMREEGVAVRVISNG